MAFKTTNNYNVIAGEVDGNQTFSEKLNIPATRGAVQKTFNGLVDMLNSNFATKQMNSTTVYLCESKADSFNKVINMPSGFVLYDGVKFLVNVIQTNTKDEPLTLDLRVKDASYTSKIELERKLVKDEETDEYKVVGDDEVVTKNNNIVENSDATSPTEVNILGPIFINFTKTAKGYSNLSKGLYVVEYIKDRILTSNEYLKVTDLDSLDEDVKTLYDSEKVDAVPEDRAGLTKDKTGFLVDNTGVIYDSTGAAPLLKKTRIKQGFNFLSTSSQVNTKTTIDKDKLYFTFIESLDNFSEVAQEISGSYMQNQSYKGTAKDLWNVDAYNQARLTNKSSVKDFYYSPTKEKLYLPDTYFTGGTQVSTLNNFKIEFTKDNTEDSKIYVDDEIKLPHAVNNDNDWTTSQSAYINAFTYTGQSRAVMTQEIKNSDHNFFFGVFDTVKDTSVETDYSSQQVVKLNETLSFNPGFTYENTYNSEAKEGKRSKIDKAIGRLKTSAAIEGQIRLIDKTNSTASYAEKDCMLKIDSEDDFGNVTVSKNRILKNDSIVMHTGTTIYSENVDVNTDLVIGNGAQTEISDEALGNTIVKDKLNTSNYKTDIGIKFARVLNKSSGNLLNDTEKADGDKNLDVDFSYVLGIDGLNKAVHVRRIDENLGEDENNSAHKRWDLQTVKDESSSSYNNNALVSLNTLFRASPKIAGTYDYDYNTSFWCPTYLPSAVPTDDLGNEAGDILTVVTPFKAGLGYDDDTGKVGWVSRKELLQGSPSFGWNNNVTIKINSGLKAKSTQSIISNIPNLNSPGQLFNTLVTETNRNEIADHIETESFNALKDDKNKNNDIEISFEKRASKTETVKANSAEIQLTLGDSGVVKDGDEVTKGQTVAIGSTTALSLPFTTAPTTTNTADEIFGQTLLIPRITVNTKGIVTALEEFKIYIPTVQEILLNASPFRNNVFTIKNSNGDVLGTLQDNGTLTIANTNKLELESIKVKNLEVDSNLLVPNSTPAGKSKFNSSVNYSTSTRAIYAN